MFSSNDKHKNEQEKQNLFAYLKYLKLPSGKVSFIFLNFYIFYQYCNVNY
jgi:hypothetical protein